MIRKFCALVSTVFLTVQGAYAAPGVGEKVYGATVEAGKTELEARYGRLSGGPADGEDGLVLEIAHGFSKHFYSAALFEFEREAGDSRRLAAIGLEGIVPIGRIDSLKLDVALYGEFVFVRSGRDETEAKLLLQHKTGGFDSRLNLKFNRPLQSGAPVEVSYQASADWAIGGEFRAGVAAFGDLGSSDRLFPRAQHFAGPIVKTEIEHLPANSELEIEAGYLRAIGAARDDTKGQFRLLLEWEFRF